MQNKSGVQFRRVNFEDPAELGFIAEIDSKIPLQYDPNFLWSEQSIAAKLDQYIKQISVDDYFEVAQSENRIVGFHAIKKMPYPPDLFAAAIFTLWIDPEYRGHKIAGNLKDRGEKWAKQNNCKYMITNVHAQNAQMLALNQNAGFETIQFSMRKSL